MFIICRAYIARNRKIVCEYIRIIGKFRSKRFCFNFIVIYDFIVIYAIYEIGKCPV